MHYSKNRYAHIFAGKNFFFYWSLQALHGPCENVMTSLCADQLALIFLSTDVEQVYIRERSSHKSLSAYLF